MIKVTNGLRNDARSNSIVRVREFMRDNSYYIAFFLYSVWTWLSRSSFIDDGGAVPIKLVEKMVQAIVLVFLSGAFFRTRATAREFSIAAVLFLLGFIVWRTAGEGWLFWLALFIVCGKGVKLSTLSSVALASVLLVTLLAGTASAAGVIDNNVVVRGSTGAIRNPLGFDHPNYLGAALLVVCMSLVPFAKGKRIVLLSVCCVLAACVSGFIADSRACALCLGALALVLPIYEVVRRRGWGRRTGLVLLVALIAMVLVSFYFMVFYNPSRTVDALLNSALSGRLQLAHTYYLDHTPGAFGYSYSDGTVYYADGKEYTFVVDNLFVHVLLRYGVIACAVFLFGLIALCIKTHKEKYFGPLLLGMGVFLVYGMSETLGCRVECNFFIISLWTVLYHRPISDFDDTVDSARANSASESNLPNELSFREFLMLPIRIVRLHRG